MKFEPIDVVIAIILGSIPVVIISAMVYYDAKNAKMVEMVRMGAHPMEVSCAFDSGSEGERALCATYFAHK